MTIADIIGPVDVYSAFVAVGAGAAITIITVTALARTGHHKLDQDFELAKLRAKYEAEDRKDVRDIEREKALAQIAVNKEIEIKRIDSGMIDVKSVR